MKLTRIELRYWDYCIVGDIIAAICKDGLLFMFEYEDISHILADMPKARNGVWLFPNKDREIAELLPSGRVSVNPQFVYINWTADQIIL